MLSEEAKALLEQSCKVIDDTVEGCLHKCIQDGLSPLALVRTFIGDHSPGMMRITSPRAENIRENIDEAAQYLAGLLGLM